MFFAYLLIKQGKASDESANTIKDRESDIRQCLLLEVAAPIHRGQATLFMAPLSVIATSPIERARGGDQTASLVSKVPTAACKL